MKPKFRGNFPRTKLNLKDTQNFLKSSSLVKFLIEKSGITSKDLVLEIGSGKGIITKNLAVVASKVYSYELDYAVLETAKENTKEFTNVAFFNQNFLEVSLPKEPYKVFANLPFNQTAALLNKLLFAHNLADSINVIVQKEAALRYMGKGEGTLISLLLRPVFTFEITHTFNRFDFEPFPNVETVLLSIRKKQTPDFAEELLFSYRDFVAFCLNQQKPTLWDRVNKIFTKEQFKRLAVTLNFDENCLAKELNYSQWVGLFNYFVHGVIPEKKTIIRDSFRFYMRTKDKQPKVNRTRSKVLTKTRFTSSR